MNSLKLRLMVLGMVAAGLAMMGPGLSIASADSTTVTVAGTANPFLSGMPPLSTCCFGDSLPAEAPTLVSGIPITAGETLTFTNVTGSTSYAGGTPTDPPDGNSGLLLTTSAYEGGNQSPDNIAGFIGVPVDSLVGVFLGPGAPTSNPAPSSIDFSSIGLSFSTLSPGLQQAFFIGDGLTGSGTGSVQTFIVPAGATALYLGSADGFGWYNNTGSFDVTVNTVGVAPTPEASSRLLLLVGIAGLALCARRFRVNVATPKSLVA